MNFVPDDLPSPLLVDAYRYWAALPKLGELPSRASIDPADMRSFLAFVVLVDVLAEPLDFRFRLAGTQVVERFGGEITGRLLSEIDVDGKYREIFEEYRLTFEKRSPAYFEDSFLKHDGRYVSYGRLLCPLASDGSRIDILFGVQVPLR